MSKITLQGHILVSDADLPAVIDELPNHMDLTRSESGCLIFDVCQNSENPNRFDVYEEYENSDSFHAHQERVKSSFWGKVTSNVERFYEVSGLD